MGKKQQHQHEVGWLLTAPPCHDHCDVTPMDGESLQSLSLETFAKTILPEYLSHSPSCLDQLFALTESCSLATLSIWSSSSSNNDELRSDPVMNQQLAQLFLKQSHARRLALHFPSKQSLDEILHDVVVSEDDNDNNNMLCKERETTSSSSSQLERLELVDVELSMNALEQLLSLFPKLTHLSLSNSTWRQQQDGALNNNNNNKNFKEQCAKILLSNHQIRVLDLSHCTWVDDEFIYNLILADSSNAGSLEWVGLGGGDIPLLSQQQQTSSPSIVLWNMNCRGRPLFVETIQKRQCPSSSNR